MTAEKQQIVNSETFAKSIRDIGLVENIFRFLRLSDQDWDEVTLWGPHSGSVTTLVPNEGAEVIADVYHLGQETPISSRRIDGAFVIGCISVKECTASDGGIRLEAESAERVLTTPDVGTDTQDAPREEQFKVYDKVDLVAYAGKFSLMTTSPLEP